MPPPDYRQRTIDTPAKEWLDVDEAAAYLGYDRDEFLDRVKERLIRPGARVHSRKLNWSWRTVQASSWERDWIDQEYERIHAERTEQERRRKGSRDAGSPET